MAQQQIDRPPRILPELPTFDVKVPPPPQSAGKSTPNIITMLMPMVMMIGMGIGIARDSVPLTVIMVVLVAAFAGYAIHDYMKQRRDGQRQIEAYVETLKQLRRDMDRWHDVQRIYYHHVFPSTAQLAGIAQLKVDSRYGMRLWERRRSDPDFGTICLGISSRPSTVVYTFDAKNQSDGIQSIIRDAQKLSDDSRIVAKVPVSFSLCKSIELTRDGTKEISARHAVCLYGHADAPLAEAGRSAIAQLTTLHSPDDLRLYLIAPDTNKEDWGWCEWLPHSSSETIGRGDGAVRSRDQMCFVGRNSESDIEAFWNRLGGELNQRQIRLRSEDSAPGKQDTPLIVLIVDLRGKLLDRTALRDVLTEPSVALITKHGQEIGAAVLFITSDSKRIPSGCRAVCEISQSESGLVFRYAEAGINTPRFVGSALAMPVAAARNAIAASMRSLTLRLICSNCTMLPRRIRQYTSQR
jgi:hypothetical protein